MAARSPAVSWMLLQLADGSCETRRPPAQTFGRAPRRGRGIVQLVGQSGGELAQRGQAIALLLACA